MAKDRERGGRCSETTSTAAFRRAGAKSRIATAPRVVGSSRVLCVLSRCPLTSPPASLVAHCRRAGLTSRIPLFAARSALHPPLLPHAVCALVARSIGRSGGMDAIHGSSSRSRRSRTRPLFPRRCCWHRCWTFFLSGRRQFLVSSAPSLVSRSLSHARAATCVEDGGRRFKHRRRE